MDSMQGMGGGGGPGVQLVLLGVFCALAVFYATRAAVGCVSTHAPHLLMALGMVYMTLPGSWQVLPVGAWLVVFGAASTWCVARVRRRWRQDHRLDLEFVHSDLAGCVAMTVMLPLFTIAGMVAALPIAIALGTYFLAYTALWGWRVCARRADPDGGTRGGVRPEAIAQLVMGGGMAYMFLVM